MARCCAPNLSKAAKVLCGGGYSGENFANAARMLSGAEVEAAKRNEPCMRLAASVCDAAETVGS